ncbi:MAG TPA: DUF4143 domain-containing protein [Verrucomicrobiales bacterium]|nr:DUF4143 domain-containing protein [Verrucomicrobiales bacterium]
MRAFITLSEVGVAEAETLWLRGGFPLSYLADSDADSAQWREFYIRTFLERDIPALGIQIAPIALRRFWNMLVHCHGQVFNASDVGRWLNVADTTVRRYLDTLAGTLMVRRLQPWFENIGKRQVRKLHTARSPSLEWGDPSHPQGCEKRRETVLLLRGKRLEFTPKRRHVHA